MITLYAPAGIGEISPTTDLADEIIAACAGGEIGGLADGDILVVTSKVISKQEGQTFPAEDRVALRKREAVRTVARKLGTTIVATHHGLVQAAAGIDASNVTAGVILALPADPDASAARLLADLRERTGAQVGVIISDTAGRAWRIGQTDHAIGCAGVRPLLSYAGEMDAYGNELRVTLTAIADEISAAADLAKTKLGGRPVAVIRGLAEHVVDVGEPARRIARPVDEDLFSHGAREAVLAALLATLGAADRYEELVELDTADEVIAALNLAGADREWTTRLLTTAYGMLG